MSECWADQDFRSTSTGSIGFYQKRRAEPCASGAWWVLCTGGVDPWQTCQLHYTRRVNQDLVHISNNSWKGADLLCKHMLTYHAVRGFAKAVPHQHGFLLLCSEHVSGIRPNGQCRCHTDLDRSRKSTRGWGAVWAGIQIRVDSRCLPGKSLLGEFWGSELWKYKCPRPSYRKYCWNMAATI